MFRRPLSFTVAVAALAASFPLSAAPEDYAGIIADEARLDANRQLDENRRPAEVLDFAGFKEGQVVADYLAGAGYFSEMIATIVGPEGRVYPMNPVGFHNAEAWSAIGAMHENISPLIAANTHLQLAPGSVDAILTHLTFHDLYWESERFEYARLDVPSVLQNWHMALKPGGTVVVVDHYGPEGDTREVVERIHRIEPATVIGAMQRAGFELVDRSEALANPEDDLGTSVFDESVRGKTSRFMLKFRKM